jgi:hypothetical protein
MDARTGPDRERVVRLRAESLERAGYTPEQAADIAGRLEIDLQHALAVRRQGLPPDVAYELVLGGGRTVF